ncbi:MAG: two-component regulator propeller domain-containing protein [Prolixibacteraceae bacterium]
MTNKRTILLIFFIFSLSRLLAIDSNFDSYSVLDGLSNSSIKAIYQDNLGFIWFGTKDGLNRFDGIEFRTYRFDNKKSNFVFYNDITCITADETGNMWIGTFDGIAMFNPLTEEYFDFDKLGIKMNQISGVVTQIVVDKEKRIWVSTKKGLYMIDSRTYKIKTLLDGIHVSSLGECSEGHLLADINGKGLALVDTKLFTIQYLSGKWTNKRPLISKIYKDRMSRIWLAASTNSLFLYSNDDQSIQPVSITSRDGLVFNNEQIHCINELNDSTLILGTDKGFLVLEINKMIFNGKVYLLSGQMFLKDDRIMSLLLDNQGGLWAGTFNKGVKYFNPYRKKFNFYELKKEGEVPVGIIGMIVENEGKLWIGHEKGISSMELKTGKSTYYNLLPIISKNSRSNESYFIYKIGQNRLCFYLLNNGLFILDLKSMRIVNQINIPPTSQVRVMMKDKNGRLWIAEEDLSIYDPILTTLENNLETNLKSYTKFTLTQDLLQLKNGDMLVGTRTKGVFRYIYDDPSGLHYSKVESLQIKGLENKNISTLFEDSRGRIWIGTYGTGLFCYDIPKNQLTVYNEANGLCHNVICGILEDYTTGDIWISTVRGVSEIDVSSGAIRNYTFKTGFPLGEISLHSFLKGSDGQFYIGGSNGIASFDPHSFIENPHIPKVQITAIQSLSGQGESKKVNLTSPNSIQHIELKYSNNNFVIKFSALSYLFPKENRFSYMLVGFDKEWINTERNEATFTNLTEGDYEFCVKASNNDGLWNNDCTRLKITVLPPFWRTIWAKIIYVALFLTFLFVLIQYLIIRNSYKYQRQIDQIEKDNLEKNYQMKISLFTNFSHELRTPLTLIVGPVTDLLHDLQLPQKFLYPLQLINKNANRLLLLVNQLMDFRKLEYGAMRLQAQNVDLLTYMNDLVDSYEEFAKKKRIKLVRQFEYDEKDVWFDVLLMEKVVFNLVSNALKVSTEGGEIVLRTYREGRSLILSVKDTGPGIANHDIERIFDPFYQVNQGNLANMFGSGIGLNLSKDIVNLHQGSIWAESTLGEGAIFYVKIGLGNQHLSKIQMVDQSESYNYNLEKSLEKNSLSIIQESDGRKPVSENYLNNVSILIVEDDADLRHYLKTHLSLEYTVYEADDGKKGFEIAKEKLPDLIVSDVMMPISSGIEMCDQIKADMRTCHIPVILLTARVMNTQIQEGYEHQADDYILKPFDPELLKIRVRNLIGGRIKLRHIFGQKAKAPETGLSELSSNDRLMQKLIDIIQKNVTEPDFCIEDILDELAMSRAQLYRKIKVMTDLTPNNLILQIRMKMAIKLLVTKDFNISEVAYQVGFSDPAYFSKYFKSVYKMTPTDYINKQNSL